MGGRADPAGLGNVGRDGLILARTASGKLIRLRNFCHVLLCGGTGSGKGVSVIIPQLLSYKSGSCVCFDTKGDLFTITAQRRKNMGHGASGSPPSAVGRTR